MNSSPNPSGRWYWRLIVPLLTFAAGGAVTAVLLTVSQQRPGDGSSVSTESLPAGRALRVNTVSAERTDTYQSKRSFSGIVQARRSSELSFDQAGRIVDMLVSVGTRVAEGDALCRLDANALLGQKQRLETQRDRELSKLAQLSAEPRARSLLDLNARLQQLKTRIERLETDATNGGQPLSPGLAETRRSAQSLDVATRDPEVEAQRRVVATLEEQLAEVDARIQRCTLRAPFDGQIARQYLGEGASAGPGVAVVRVVQPSQLEASFGLPAELGDLSDRVHEIRVGGRKYPATISSLSPELDPSSRTRQVVFELQLPESADLIPGQLAELVVGQQIDSEGFWLPVSALMHDVGGEWAVFVAEPTAGTAHRVTRRWVDVDDMHSDRVRVHGMLDDGELVIANGTHRVVSGQRVQAASSESIIGADSEADWR